MRPIRRPAHTDAPGRTYPIRRKRRPRKQSKWRPCEVVAVELARDTEGLAEPSRPGREGLTAGAAGAHDVRPRYRIESAHEHGPGLSVPARHHVQTPMDPVATVDVDATGWTEHRPIPVGDPGRRAGVRGGILRPAVRFGLDDRARNLHASDGRHDPAPEQGPSQLQRTTCTERPYRLRRGRGVDRIRPSRSRPIHRENRLGRCVARSRRSRLPAPAPHAGVPRCGCGRGRPEAP